jgi:hypothetical protein
MGSKASMSRDSSFHFVGKFSPELLLPSMFGLNVKPETPYTEEFTANGASCAVGIAQVGAAITATQ